MLKILTYPHPILRKKAKPVKEINKEIKDFVKEMILFLRPSPRKFTGVGLAAPQVGKLLRIIVVWSKRSRQFLPMINPQIIWKSKRTRLGIPQSPNPYEGCLSLPYVWGKVRRHNAIKVQYQTLSGATVVRKFKGFTAVVIQHEIDHLDGILFIDRIKEQKGQFFTNLRQPPKK
ncbi:MAG: peptide deformylase [Microgenomates group bacterium]